MGARFWSDCRGKRSTTLVVKQVWVYSSASSVVLISWAFSAINILQCSCMYSRDPHHTNILNNTTLAGIHTSLLEHSLHGYKWSKPCYKIPKHTHGLCAMRDSLSDHIPVLEMAFFSKMQIFQLNRS